MLLKRYYNHLLMAEISDTLDLRCPRCVQLLAGAAPQCEHCGFDLESLDGVFGEEVVFLDRVTDPTGELRGRDRTLLAETLERFDDRFPQLYVATYLGYLPEVTTIRQFGFWLMNRAAINGVDVDRPNHHGILFVVDLQGQSVGLTLGYQVEPFLTHADRGKILRAGTRAFNAGDYGRGLRDCIKQLGDRLASGSRKAARQPERFGVGGQNAPAKGIGLVPLRIGHKFLQKVRPSKVEPEELEVEE